MYVLIPAAGKSTRFLTAGYTTPKPWLQVDYNGRSKAMIEHVLDTIPYYDNLLIGVPPGYARRRPDVVISHSRGQADTLLQLTRHVEHDDDCLVLNSDVLFKMEQLNLMLQLTTGGGALMVQRSHDPAMSYVDTIPHPTRFAEKERISDWGISGAWAVGSVHKLRDALEEVVGEAGPGEPYLSHALNRLKDIHWTAMCIRPEEMVDWNTPMALEKSGARIIC